MGIYAHPYADRLANGAAAWYVVLGVELVISILQDGIGLFQ